MAVVPTVEQLYESGQKLAEPKEDVSKLEDDYRRIVAGAKGDSKAQQLAAQFIPKFFKTFPAVQHEALDAQLDLCEEEEFAVRVQAIRGLPQIAKDVPEYLQKSADILTQLLAASEPLELEAVKKAIVTILRLDAKTTLEAIFTNLENADSALKPLVHQFFKEKIFSTRQEWMKPSNKAELEKVLSELISRALSNATPSGVREFLELLLSLDLYSKPEGKDQVQVLLDVVSNKAGQQEPFDASNEDALQNLIAYTSAAIPLLKKGGTSSSLVHHFARTVLPNFDRISAAGQLSFLKVFAETSPYVSGADARIALPVLLEVMKKLLPRRKDTSSVSEDGQYFILVESLLYTFHQLANKVPNATNPLCGYKIVTGQPSDRLNEDFTPQYSEFTERLAVLEERTKKQQKALTEAAQQTSKEITEAKEAAAKKELEAKNEEQKTSVKNLKNLTNLIKPLHARTPKFMSGSWRLSWQDAPASTSGAKRSGDVVNGAPGKRPAIDAAGRGPQNGGQRGRGRGGWSSGGGRGGQGNTAGGNLGGRGRGGRGRGSRGGRGRY